MGHVKGNQADLMLQVEQLDVYWHRVLLGHCKIIVSYLLTLEALIRTSNTRALARDTGH